MLNAIRWLLDHLRIHKDAIQAVGSLAAVAAVGMGGVWTLFLWRWRRLRYPRLNVQHKIFHWAGDGKVALNEKVLLHVAVETTSVGEVIVRLESMLVRVQQLVPLPPEVLEAMAPGNELVLPDNESEVAWPEIAKRECNWKAHPYEIEPGETEEYHFDFAIPADVEKIEVYSHIVNKKKARRLWRRFWQGRREFGWNTTTVYSFKTAEEHMSNDKKEPVFRTGQGVPKKAPAPASPPPKK